MRALVYLVGYLSVYKDCLITFDSLWPSDAIWCWGSWSTLVQVMACCLMASSHYLNQCWLIICEVFWYLLEDSFTGNAQHIYLIFNMSLKIPNVMLQLHLPGDNELMFLFPAKWGHRNAYGPSQFIHLSIFIVLLSMHFNKKKLYVSLQTDHIHWLFHTVNQYLVILDNDISKFYITCHFRWKHQHLLGSRWTWYRRG